MSCGGDNNNNNNGVTFPTGGESKIPGSENNSTSTSSDEQGQKTQDAKSGLSKNQLRKLKNREKWLAIKADKRKHERAKKKKRYADARSQGISLGPSRKALKLNSMKDSKCQIRVAVDCSFDNLMSEKDVMKLVKQLQSCYSVNRRVENPLQFYVCGINGQTKERLDNIGDCKNWDVYFTAEKYTEKFEKAQLIYLSSESENILTELENDKVYIIGGLVDHNSYKGLCHRLAVENDIAHAQLPISEYIQMKSRKVLTVNHVFEILLRYTENKDWKQSLCQVIPKRKGIIPLSCRPDENDSDNPGVSGTPSATTKGQCSEELEKLNSKISGENSLSDDESTKNLKLNNVDI